MFILTEKQVPINQKIFAVSCTNYTFILEHFLNINERSKKLCVNNENIFTFCKKRVAFFINNSYTVNRTFFTFGDENI